MINTNYLTTRGYYTPAKAPHYKYSPVAPFTGNLIETPLLSFLSNKTYSIFTGYKTKIEPFRFYSFTSTTALLASDSHSWLRSFSTKISDITNQHTGTSRKQNIDIIKAPVNVKIRYLLLYHRNAEIAHSK